MVRYSFLVRLLHPLLQAGFYPGAFPDTFFGPPSETVVNGAGSVLLLPLRLADWR